MRKLILSLVGLVLLGPPLAAQTADDIVTNYLKTVGGMEKIQAVKTVRRSGN